MGRPLGAEHSLPSKSPCICHQGSHRSLSSQTISQSFGSLAPEIGQIAAPCYVHLPGRRPNLSPGKAPGASCPPVTPLDFCAFLNHRVWETAGESVNKLRKSQLALSFELRIKSELCSWPTRRHVTWGSSPPLSPSPAFLFPVHADSFPQRRLCPCRCLCPRGS